jgi:hypothetical protein
MFQASEFIADIEAGRPSPDAEELLAAACNGYSMSTPISTGR